MAGGAVLIQRHRSPTAGAGVVSPSVAAALFVAALLVAAPAAAQIGGPIGAPVYAAADGVISFAGVRQGYGNCVEIDHGNGLVTRYAHLSAFRAAVGQSVDAGAVVGAIGNTGRSTGPHLHFEVRIHDRAVNPRPFLEAATRKP